MEYNFINFSFFEIDSLTAMKEAVREVFIQDFQKRKANFIKTPFIISEFIDPSYGGKHDDVFCCWQVSHYPNKIFFISNSGDGRITLCNVLRLKLHCSFYQFALSNDNASPFFCFITAVPFRNLPVRIGLAYSNRLTLSREQSC